MNTCRYRLILPKDKAEMAYNFEANSQNVGNVDEEAMEIMEKIPWRTTNGILIS